MPSSTPLRRVISRALRAASRARAASTILPQMILASIGFSSSQSVSRRLTMSSTGARTSLETSLSLVWLENLGSGTFTLTTQARPSRMSSPAISTLAFLAKSLSSMYLLMTRVIAARRPVRWVPPSRCGMLLVKHSTDSLYVSFHCIATSTDTGVFWSLIFSPWAWKMFGFRMDLPLLMNSTKPFTPPM